MIETAVLPDAVLPLLVAEANVEFLPAQLWPLDAAFVVLAREVPDASPVSRALSRMPQATQPNSQRFTGLRSSIQRLVAKRMLKPEGCGWDAGYVVSPEMRDRGSQMLAALSPPERAALRDAAQVLSDASRMLSKNVAASALSGSPTI
jgi:hypothetical protein